MFQNDYIMRMIFQMGEFLLNLKNRLKEEQYEDSLNEIDKQIKELTGMDPHTFNGLDYQNVSNIIGRQGAIDWAKCIFISEALREKGHVYELLNNEDESFYYYLKSLNYVLYLVNNCDNFEVNDYVKSVNLSYSKIKDYVIPFETKKMLIEYLKIRGKYAEAENMIYELLNEGNQEDYIIMIDKGVKFYESILNVPEENLIIGGLPKEEVIEGLENLKNKLN